MINIKNPNQLDIFDPWNFLTPKRRKMLDSSWPGLFREHILPSIPVHKVAKYFDETFGRPTKELYSMLGTLILQQTLDLTDEETVRQYAFDTQWHYALNITEESDTAKYISLRTVWSNRNIVSSNRLEDEIFNAGTDKLAQVFNVNTDKQRLDSVHIKSNMRGLGRIGIFSESIHKFLLNLKRGHRDQFETLDGKIYEQSVEFKDRYRWRAGVEATMSEYDRRTGVKHLRVRGLKAVRFCATLKALGVNIFRAAAVRAAKLMPEEDLCWA